MRTFPANGILDYTFFGLLNRFYIASEREFMLSRFDSPPNCFDQFLSFTELSARKQVQDLEKQLARETEHAAQVNKEKMMIEEQLTPILSSNSWRLTAPLRAIRGKFKK